MVEKALIIFSDHLQAPKYLNDLEDFAFEILKIQIFCSTKLE